MDNMIALILTSTVVSSIITALVGYFASRRENMLKYIVEERKKWRDEMRVIAEDAAQAKYYNIGKELTRIKVRINAYGSVCHEDYQKDGHIWRVIEDLEHGADRKEDFDKNRKLLIDYISLLLKADWERSKQEVKGACRKVLQCGLILVSVITFTIYYFGIWKLSEISPYIVHVVYLVIAAVFCTFLFQEINMKVLSMGNSGQKRFRWFFASLSVYLAGMIWVGNFFIQRWESHPMDDRLIVLSCIYLCFAINLWELLSDLTGKYRYDAAVVHLRESYRGKEGTKTGAGYGGVFAGTYPERLTVFKSAVRLACYPPASEVQ